MPADRGSLPASMREPVESLPQSTAPAALLVRPCAELRADNQATWLPVPDACSGPSGAIPHDVPSRLLLPVEDACRYAAGTSSIGVALVTDPAWPPLAPGQDRARLPILHPVPRPQSDPRSGDYVPASMY